MNDLSTSHALPTDIARMETALAVADLARPWCSPNPAVGCVLYDALGQCVGQGFTQAPRHGLHNALHSGLTVAPKGEHAEIMALRQAGAKAKGASAYITLEPCHHQGQTPPCTEALLKAGIARVYYLHQDPNPKVSGQGAAYLRAQGLEVVLVHTPKLCQAGLAINGGFIKRMSQELPRITLKLATSLDGHMALPDGQSQFITSHKSRTHAHTHFRALSDAILTGFGTLLADNPTLDARLSARASPPPFQDTAYLPLRVCLDSQARLPLDAKLFQAKGIQKQQVRVLLAHKTLDKKGQARLDALAKAHQGLQTYLLSSAPENAPSPMLALLKHLGSMGVNELLIEAGPRLNGYLMAYGLVDQIAWYQAPILLSQGLGAFAPPLAAKSPKETPLSPPQTPSFPVSNLDKAPRLEPVSRLNLEQDQLTYFHCKTSLCPNPSTTK